MLKANPSFCILSHLIIIGVCFGINIKLLIDSNDGFNHEIGNGPQPQYLPPNFSFHREA
ncbi:DNA-directed RNA polymerases II, IV and V subunit 3-like [Pyrus ussuriensis x Pyrus communis]|uniref:DNA-directed RNA polymerases II, IV and V subunit 3-like n=1 Tax=Pyrus ussuriensis x Pyrus communis TaxID=2448454 RepID=A0A5N5FSE8_9ROSA|nr:DNA-directed RNA polymerases II, IV and V subunit 3-like [Pyrus ussuriensis x Pyrus communis]